MKQIIVTEPGNISPEQMQMLFEAGYTVIEAKDPEKVKFLIPSVEGLQKDVMESALFAMDEADSLTCNREFISELCNRLKKKK